MEKWNNFYSNRMMIEELLANLNTHSLLFAKIIENNPSKILEIGTGTGSMSMFLALLGYNITSLDNNEEILVRAQKMNKEYKTQVRLIEGDAFSIPFLPETFDIVYSQGFFEHFDNEEIHKLIKEQLRVGDIVIFSIPSKYYLKKDYGNERLLDIKDWEKISKEYKLLFIKYYSQSISLLNIVITLLRYPYFPIKKPQQILVGLSKK